MNLTLQAQPRTADIPGRPWRRVGLATIARRVADLVDARRWYWVEYCEPGHAPKLALMGPLAKRVGLLEFTLKRRRNRGAWVRRLVPIGGEKKGGA